MEGQSAIPFVRDRKKEWLELHDAEVRAIAIDELVEETMKKFTEYELTERIHTVTDCKILLRDVAEKLKAGGMK